MDNMTSAYFIDLSPSRESARRMRSCGNVLQQVGPLPIRSVIPLIDFPIAGNNRRAQRMRNQPAFFFVGESKVIGELRQFRRRNRGKFPMFEQCRIFASRARESVIAQDLWSVVSRIEANAQQMRFAIPRLIAANGAVDLGKLVAHARAEIRKRAARVYQRQQQSLAPILMQRNPPSVLIDELEIRYVVSRLRNVQARRRLC